jgi:hypothetical protein
VPGPLCLLLELDLNLRDVLTRVRARDSDSGDGPDPIGLGATGEIDGLSVRCLSREMQLQAHTGYALPAHHLKDLEMLDSLS